MPHSTCLKWHGGKSYLANWIVSKMVPHLNYVEPYAGGLSVLFARDPMDERLWLAPHKGVSEVVCDLNQIMTQFWMTLQHPKRFEILKRRLEATPFSETEWMQAQWMLEQGWSRTGANGDEMAWAFFVTNRQSLAGRMQCFTGITKTRLRRGMNNEVSAWLSAIEGLPEVHDRLKRVLILPPQPALKVIKKFDMPETLFYLDPPYCHETRATTGEYGQYEMSEADHVLLVDECRASKAKIMLSGYDNSLYNRRLSDWNRHEFKVPNQASHAKTKEIKTEVLWLNY